MSYLLVQNKTTVLLGPIAWRQRFIQSEIDELVDQGELSTTFIVPPVEQGYIDIGEGFEIFPVSLEEPALDLTYQHPAGPFWTYENNVAIGTYTSYNLDINIVKANLKSIAAAERYRKECLGTTATVQDTVVSLTTDRDTRGQYAELLNTVGDGTINYKTSNNFLLLSFSDIQIIVTAVHDYIQLQFDWEKIIYDSIDTATTIDELKEIEIIPPIMAPILLRATD